MSMSLKVRRPQHDLKTTKARSGSRQILAKVYGSPSSKRVSCLSSTSFCMDEWRLQLLMIALERVIYVESRLCEFF